MTTNQHMVAQLIQKEFSYDEEKLKTYGIKEIPIVKENKENKKKEIVEIKYETKSFSIEDTMYAKLCYEFDELQDAMGCEKPNFMENMFATIYENNYKDILVTLKEMLTKRKSYKEIESFIENKVMIYFVLFYLKTYQFTLYSNEKKKSQQEQTFNRFKEMIFNVKYVCKLAITILNNYNLYILDSKNNDFLLSDSFIATASFDYKGAGINPPFYLNRSIGLTNIIILIPISSRFYLMYTDNKKYKNLGHYINLYKNVKDEYKNIDFYNSIIYRNSYQFTIGKNIEMIKHIKETIPKYALCCCAGGHIDKNEIWCDVEIDKEYYLTHAINQKKGVGYTKYKTNGNFFVEKPLNKNTTSLKFKLIACNPNFKNNKSNPNK